LSIITQGLGGTHLISQGYGYSIGYLTIQLAQTLIFADSLSKKWNAIRTFPENLKHTDGILHKWDIKYIIGEIMSFFETTYPRIVIIPIGKPEEIRPGLPWIRIPIEKIINIYGDLYHPIEAFMTVQGDLVVRIKVSQEVYGDLIKKFEKETITVGDFVKKYAKSLEVKGDLDKQIDKIIHVKADLVKEILGNYDVKGEKDWKRFIIEVILEEEENGND